MLQRTTTPTPTQFKRHGGGPSISKKYLRILSLAAAFVAGIFLGRLLAGGANTSTAQFATSLVQGYAQNKDVMQLANAWLSNFSGYFFLFLVLYFCTFCAISAPVLYGVLFFKGVGIGLVYTAMLLVYGSNALLYIGVVLLPKDLVLTCLLLLAAAQSLPLCTKLWRQMRAPSAPMQGGIAIKSITVKYIIFTVISGGLIFIFTVVEYLLSAAIQLV